MADAAVVTALRSLCITDAFSMKTIGGLLLLCAVTYFCSSSGELRVDSALYNH